MHIARSLVLHFSFRTWTSSSKSPLAVRAVSSLLGISCHGPLRGQIESMVDWHG